MSSFRISITPHRKAAARFVKAVHRSLQQAHADNSDLTQTALANELGVHRSVVNRQLRGHEDMSIARAAELGYLMGYEPHFELRKREEDPWCNVHVQGTFATNAAPVAARGFSSGNLTTTVTTTTSKKLADA